MSRPLVQLHNINVHFSIRKGLFGSESVQAVDGVTLDMQAGEVVAVVGESGSGKTTLGRAMLGLVKITDGQIRFGDTEITTLSPQARRSFSRKAQAIFQDPFASIDPFMTVYDSVAEPLVIHGIGTGQERRDQVLQVLHDVRLRPAQEIAAKYPDLLSGGQRQRLGIARALVLRPQFIVADEPVSMVDASSRAELLALLRELRDRFNIAFLYITHDIATARHFAQRIVVMYLGRIVEMGPAAAVVGNPLHPYTQALIASVPEPDPANRLRMRPSLPGEPPSPIHRPSGCSFHPRCAAFMPGQCDMAVPRLHEVEPNHFVACYLH